MSAIESTNETALPAILAGPIIRRLTHQKIAFWLVTTTELQWRIELTLPDKACICYESAEIDKVRTQIQLAKHCFTVLIDLPFKSPMPADTLIPYQIYLRNNEHEPWRKCTDLLENICYPSLDSPAFVIGARLKNILHGSCRKIHHSSTDAFVRIDDLLESKLKTKNAATWPSVLVQSGDQIYVDFVAGPTLKVIQALIKLLQFKNEIFEPSLNSEITVSDSKNLNETPYYYRRESLLPRTTCGKQKRVFTAVNTRNHLMSLAEITCMYLLVWSPTCWSLADSSPPESLSDEQKKQYRDEQKCVENFVENLDKTQRVLAHVATAMIFDDHDVTDDWNLTAAWEQAVYNDPLSQRIIGNALLAYLVFQGLGNAPEKFSPALIGKTQKAFAQPGSEVHKALLEEILEFSEWHYSWQTQPPLVVLDTRTQRWRSERSLNKPSGLMDWEALTELQQQLIGLDSVVLVSPAPIFGVKLIEAIQRVFTFFGNPLAVDAENWMAHPGAARFLMNMFHHSRTPQHFIILSGDVHYSFAYHIELRRNEQGPQIWQITSSGLRNTFPKTILEILDRLNRWLYAPWSPLNFFTKRRSMRVIPHKPEPASKGERLVNASGVGWVELDENNVPVKIMQLCSDQEDVEFISDENEARWE